MKVLSSKLKTDQQGFASIIIAIILVLILSLITVGFAQLMRTEQRQALDKQLSSQAYYAAESGINDAAKAINGGYTQAKTGCGPITTGPGSVYFSSNIVGSNTGASYPCLLINPTPPTLEYTSISTTTSKVAEMQGIDPTTGSPTAIQTITLSWQDANNNTTFTTDCNAFYPASGGGTNWTYTGILRAELIPINDLSQTGLINNAYTAFLCPNQAAAGSSGSLGYQYNVGNGSGAIVPGNCNTANTPFYCTVVINGLGSLNESTFFLDLRSIYNSTTVQVAAYGGDGSVIAANQLNIADAQTLVDSTGKAQDVLRRLQVRTPTHNGYSHPDGPQAMSAICKQLQIWPSNGSSGASCPIP